MSAVRVVRLGAGSSPMGSDRGRFGPSWQSANVPEQRRDHQQAKSSGRTKESGCGEGDDDALARRLPSRSCADDDRVAKITKFEGFLDEHLKPGVRRTSTTIAVTRDTEGDRRDLAIFRRQVSYL